MKKVVFFLHRVYPERGDDINLSLFERFLISVKERFEVVPLYELLSEDRDSGRIRASITFDDGYADNYVYAYPILKKHGLKAHLFISAGRILDAEILRKSLDDYWEGKVAFYELFKPKSMVDAHLEFIKRGESSEFLSWLELTKMKDVFSFGSHGLSHLSAPAEDFPFDFYDGKNFHWTLSLFGEPFLGMPIFRTKSVLFGRIFKPKPELFEFCKKFPKGNKWKEALAKHLRQIAPLGEFETESQALSRIKEELLASKRKIEKRLGIKVKTLAYPFGQYSELTIEALRGLYDYAFTVKKGFLDEADNNFELPRVSVGRDFLTVYGRLFFFSSSSKYQIYRVLKKWRTSASEFLHTTLRST